MKLELNKDKSLLEVNISGKYNILEVQDLFRSLKEKELEMVGARDENLAEN